MNTYMVRIYIPVYYDLEANNEQEAQEKAIARYKQEHETWREPTVEVVMANGFPTGFWDVVDNAIDDYKERGL
jgi:hypothetical protein